MCFLFMKHKAMYLHLLFCVFLVCQHEKYTSQLQVGVNPLELGKNEQVDEKGSAADTSHSRHEKSERRSNAGNSFCLIISCCDYIIIVYYVFMMLYHKSCSFHLKGNGHTLCTKSCTSI